MDPSRAPGHLGSSRQGRNCARKATREEAISGELKREHSEECQTARLKTAGVSHLFGRVGPSPKPAQTINRRGKRWCPGRDVDSYAGPRASDLVRANCTPLSGKGNILDLPDRARSLGRRSGRWELEVCVAKLSGPRAPPEHIPL
jgi:hypothetical protein